MSEKERISFFRELYLVFLGGLLALAGTIANSYFIKSYEDRAWEQRTEFQMKQEVLTQRVKLVERTAKILNKVDILELNYLVEDLKTSLAKLGQGKLEDLIDHREVVAELNSEFLTVVSLNSYYFGPAVREAGKNIMDATDDEIRWWQTDEKLRQAYLDALNSEIILGF